MTYHKPKTKKSNTRFFLVRINIRKNRKHQKNLKKLKKLNEPTEKNQNQ